jgi:hypothetical protein
MICRGCDYNKDVHKRICSVKNDRENERGF